MLVPGIVAFGLLYGVLAALIAPAVLTPQGHLALGPRTWATLVGVIVAWRTRGILSTIASGMLVFWILRAL